MQMVLHFDQRTFEAMTKIILVYFFFVVFYFLFDLGVLSALRQALLHVIRNVVAHGIEVSGERVALHEFLSAHPEWNFCRFKDIHWCGLGFVVERADELSMLPGGRVTT